jgi:hypothetical protein
VSLVEKSSQDLDGAQWGVGDLDGMGSMGKGGMRTLVGKEKMVEEVGVGEMGMGVGEMEKGRWGWRWGRWGVGE